MQEKQEEVTCKSCGQEMRRVEKLKLSPTDPSSSYPGSNSFSDKFTTTTTSGHGTMVASRLGGSESEKPIQKFVTYICHCGHEETVEI